MELKQVIDTLRLEKHKHSREFRGEFMKDWSAEKLEQFYTKNEKVWEALDIAQKCVANIDRLKLVNEDLTKIFGELED